MTLAEASETPSTQITKTKADHHRQANDPLLFFPISRIVSIMQNLAPLLTLGLIGLCFMGNDLGDGRLGNPTKPYKAVPQFCEFVNGSMQCKPAAKPVQQ
jgi:hypothetical protein